MPQHVAVIMDGNGRWAKKRFLPRVAGHVKGVELNIAASTRKDLCAVGVSLTLTTIDNHR